MIKRAVNVIFFFLSAFAVFALSGEIYARLKHGVEIKARSMETMYRKADFVTHHSLIPSSAGRSVTPEWDVEYRVNSLGLRDREFTVHKPEGVYRILVLGDSFTEGYGVETEDSFVKLLERSLNGGSAREYEVMNCGIASYSPVLEYLFLVERGLRMDPDMVILCFDFGDLKDDYEYEQLCVFDAEGKPVKCAPYKRVRALGTSPLERFLARHSRFYLYMENRINKMIYKSQEGAARVEDGETGVLDRFIAFREGEEDMVEAMWARSERYIDLINGLLKTAGVELVLVSYPYAVEIGPDEWAKGREEYGFEAGKVYPEPAVVGMMKEYAVERDIPFVDLYPYFAGRDKGLLYYAHDGHFNAKGHKTMAEGLYGGLKEQGVLEP